MSGPLRYYQGAERPTLRLWLLDDDGTLVDFSAGYTFSWSGVGNDMGKHGGFEIGEGARPGQATSSPEK